VAVRTDISKRTKFVETSDEAIAKVVQFMEEYPDFEYIQITRGGSIKGKMLLLNPAIKKERVTELVNKHVKIYFYEADDIYN